jgi:hypothetical protein
MLYKVIVKKTMVASGGKKFEAGMNVECICQGRTIPRVGSSASIEQREIIRNAFIQKYNVDMGEILTHVIAEQSIEIQKLG